MGADGQKMTPQEHYQKLNLLQPAYSDYENDFEKQLYFVINLVRHDPKTFGQEAVKAAAANHPLAKKLAKNNLLTYLSKLGTMPGVKFEDNAIKAVRANNEEKIALAEATPTRMGNIEKYNSVIGSDKTSECLEWTTCQYMGDQAMEVIGLQMLEEFNADKKTSVVEKDVCRVGISNKAHPKTKNLIQILYIKSTSNMMD